MERHKIHRLRDIEVNLDIATEHLRLQVRVKEEIVVSRPNRGRQTECQIFDELACHFANGHIKLFVKLYIRLDGVFVCAYRTIH